MTTASKIQIASLLALSIFLTLTWGILSGRKGEEPRQFAASSTPQDTLRQNFDRDQAGCEEFFDRIQRGADAPRKADVPLRSVVENYLGPVQYGAAGYPIHVAFGNDSSRQDGISISQSITTGRGRVQWEVQADAGIERTLMMQHHIDFCQIGPELARGSLLASMDTTLGDFCFHINDHRCFLFRANYLVQIDLNLDAPPIDRLMLKQLVAAIDAAPLAP